MAPHHNREVFNLPNTLTFVRFICIPIVLICLAFPDRRGSLLAAISFGLASMTDILDGFFARKQRAVTILGKFLDPLVDKILVSGTLIMLISLGRIPAWMVIVIIARELALTGLRGIAVTEGVVIQASRLGKLKTFLQSVAIIGLCLHYPYMAVDFHAVGMALMWGALILTVWSGWDYFRQFYVIFVPGE